MKVWLLVTLFPSHITIMSTSNHFKAHRHYMTELCSTGTLMTRIYIVLDLEVTVTGSTKYAGHTGQVQRKVQMSGVAL